MQPDSMYRLGFPVCHIGRDGRHWPMWPKSVIMWTGIAGDKGVGSLLMDHAMQEAPKVGFAVLIAILLNKNPASIGLVRKIWL